ncbi:hypothetical protein FPY71_07110 [Aureimonas fodinaquatilis]|uniref:Uncharacterized protein n=1 Tax=Aureimonas fodinaquatilis TaxID=2565783 RepID=A0A5B0DVC3_9HYPH|nr:hypothetical protein [Aureimonas fodinaquatilis]KAA0970288.1 hypothetical protein FPY71_07110 [Aureimonas fodinaquatilis]
MSEVKHTPGPWIIIGEMVEHGCCWDAAISAKVPLGDGKYGGDKALIAECNIENSPLIAAAPDLLTVAIRLAHAASMEPGKDRLAAFQIVADEARAAIAKAEGRS